MGNGESAVGADQSQLPKIQQPPPGPTELDQRNYLLTEMMRMECEAKEALENRNISFNGLPHCPRVWDQIGCWEPTVHKHYFFIFYFTVHSSLRSNSSKFAGSLILI